MNGSSRAADLIRCTDWSAHRLGPPDGWPAALRITLGTVLNSPESMFLAWGPDLSFFFNDAYIPSLGPRLPHAMGAPFAELWPDGFPQLRSIVEQALAGRAGRHRDLSIILARYGAAEHTWWDLSVSPVHDEAGTVAGLLGVAIETTARVAGEERLREAEGRNRQIIDSATDYAIVASDLAGRITRWNEGAHRLLGWSEAEMLGQPMQRNFTPEDIAACVPEGEMLGCLAKGTAQDDRWHMRKDGTRFWGSGQMTVLRDGAGDAAGFVKVFRDRTDERLEQEALRSVESRLALAIDIAALGTFEWHTGTGAVTLDRQSRAIFGLPPEGPVHADDILGLVEHADLPRIAEISREAAATGSPIDAAYWITLPGGGRRHILSTGRFAPEAVGPPVRMLGVFRDTTEAKRLESALQDANRQLQTDVTRRTAERDRLWDTSPDLLLVYAPDGTTLATNPAWTTLLGYAPGELTGRIGLELVHPDDLAMSRGALGRSAQAGLPLLENRIRHKDGRYLHIAWVAAPGDGVVYATGRDVSAEKRAAQALRQAEDQLRQSQKMEAVGQLTGGIAHDFNNMLTGVTGSLELLRTRIAQGRLSEVDRLVEAAQGAAKRAASLTHRLLAFSRRQTLDPKPTDVNRLIAGMNELVQRTAGPAIAVAVAGAADLWSTRIDPGQLENALLNLCINARDAMPDGGRILVETANRELDADQAAARDMEPGAYVSLSVSDTGTGMPPQVVAKAFDPFFTTKPIGMGTGLGLSMIYGFAKQSGGQVRIHSVVGQGTTIRLYLPRHHGAAAAAAHPGSLGAAPRGEGQAVLVVDDEPTLRMLVTEVLEDLGYTAMEAADGAGGLRILQSAARIDLLVTDVGLPGGMNGRQLADAARIARPGLKVLFITGYAETAVLSGYLDPGMHVLTKPFAMDALAGRIRDLIAG